MEQLSAAVGSAYSVAAAEFTAEELRVLHPKAEI